MINLFFDNRDDAKIWIIDHQLGKRNISPFDRGKLNLKRGEIIAAKAKEQQIVRKGNQPGATLQKSVKLSPIDSTKEIADMAGLSKS